MDSTWSTPTPIFLAIWIGVSLFREPYQSPSGLNLPTTFSSWTAPCPTSCCQKNKNKTNRTYQTKSLGECSPSLCRAEHPILTRECRHCASKYLQLCPGVYQIFPPVLCSFGKKKNKFTLCIHQEKIKQVHTWRTFCPKYSNDSTTCLELSVLERPV